MVLRDRHAPDAHDPPDSHVISVAGQAVLPAGSEAYAPDARGKPFAFAITLTLHVVALVGFIFYRSVEAVDAPPSAPLVVTLLPLAHPPAEMRVKAVQPRPAPRIPSPGQPHSTIAAPQPIIPTTAAPALARPDPAPSASESPPSPPTVTATVETSAPVADASGKERDSWEGRVLAALERQKRYPAASRGRREHGVVAVRFRLNRTGRVLSASIALGSGFASLDREALATLARADPLPQFPHDMPGETLELVVPVEFVLR